MQDIGLTIPPCPKGIDFDTEEPSPCVLMLWKRQAFKLFSGNRKKYRGYLPFPVSEWLAEECVKKGANRWRPSHNISKG